MLFASSKFEKNPIRLARVMAMVYKYYKISSRRNMQRKLDELFERTYLDTHLAMEDVSHQRIFHRKCIISGFPFAITEVQGHGNSIFLVPLKYAVFCHSPKCIGFP